MFCSPALRNALLSFTCLCLAPALKGQATRQDHSTNHKEFKLAAHAKGSFDVTVRPLTEEVRPGAWAPSRMSIDKQFHGNLEATSQGEMLAASTGTPGSAGYTAIEKVSGRLQGRSGTFLLQHFAVMARGVPGEWIVMVIPDSGTGGLKGITGRMTITITGKLHDYLLEYNLPDVP